MVTFFGNEKFSWVWPDRFLQLNPISSHLEVFKIKWEREQTTQILQRHATQSNQETVEVPKLDAVATKYCQQNLQNILWTQRMKKEP